MRTIPTVTLDDARRVIAAGADEAARQQQPMSIAVVDAGGTLVAQIRQDGAWIGSVDVAIDKAFSARAFDVSTEGLGGERPARTVLRPPAPDHGRVMIFAGGIPLRSGDTIVGAVGVSGGTDDQDQAVASAAAAGLDASDCAAPAPRAPGRISSTADR